MQWISLEVPGWPRMQEVEQLAMAPECTRFAFSR